MFVYGNPKDLFDSVSANIVPFMFVRSPYQRLIICREPIPRANLADVFDCHRIPVGRGALHLLYGLLTLPPKDTDEILISSLSVATDNNLVCIHVRE